MKIMFDSVPLRIRQNWSRVLRTMHDKEYDGSDSFNKWLYDRYQISYVVEFTFNGIQGLEIPDDELKTLLSIKYGVEL